MGRRMAVLRGSAMLLPLLCLAAEAADAGPARGLVVGLSATEQVVARQLLTAEAFRTALAGDATFKALPEAARRHLAARWAESVELAALSPAEAGVAELKVAVPGGKGQGAALQAIGRELCRELAAQRAAQVLLQGQSAEAEAAALRAQIEKHAQRMQENLSAAVGIRTAQQRVLELEQVIERLQREYGAASRMLKMFSDNESKASVIEQGRPVPVGVALLLGEMPPVPTSDAAIDQIKARVKFLKAAAEQRLADIGAQIQLAEAQRSAAAADRDSTIRAYNSTLDVRRETTVLGERLVAVERLRAQLELQAQSPSPQLVLLDAAGQ